MPLTHEREKLINTIVYFVKNTRYCGKLKLFKLLYFLDFEHFSQIGRSVTGLNYFAWKKGPVPVELDEELDMPESEFTKHLSFTYSATKKGQMLKISPLIDFDSRYFSKRELHIMENLIKKFKNSTSEIMIKATHQEKSAWYRVYKQENGYNKLIPYQYSVSSTKSGIINDIIQENNSIMENYS